MNGPLVSNDPLDDTSPVVKQTRNEDEPMFVMSMYVNKEALLTAKSDYFMRKSDRLEEEVKALTKRLEVADPDGETLLFLDENGYETPYE